MLDFVQVVLPAIAENGSELSKGWLERFLDANAALVGSKVDDALVRAVKERLEAVEGGERFAGKLEPTAHGAEESSE